MQWRSGNIILVSIAACLTNQHNFEKERGNLLSLDTQFVTLHGFRVCSMYVCMLPSASRFAVPSEWPNASDGVIIPESWLEDIDDWLVKEATLNGVDKAFGSRLLSPYLHWSIFICASFSANLTCRVRILEEQIKFYSLLRRNGVIMTYFANTHLNAFKLTKLKVILIIILLSLSFTYRSLEQRW